MALLLLPKGWFCVSGAKPNVPFVRLAKIVFKKCAVEKNKNTLGRLECRFTVSLVCLVTVIGFGLSVNVRSVVIGLRITVSGFALVGF